MRIGAVSYLNTRPLVWGLEQGLPGASAIELSYAIPSELTRQMSEDLLDVALLPIVGLTELPRLEIVPGLAIGSFGASRSVLIVSRCPIEHVRTLALDPESRTSNILAQVLFAEVWGLRPECTAGPTALDAALADCDAAVRIGDKALFDPLPDGLQVHDMGTVWTEKTGLPFVFAVWAARPGAVDRQLYRLLHASRRMGSRSLGDLTRDYQYAGRPQEELARQYLEKNIRFRLGATELRAAEVFFRAAARLELIDHAPELHLALQRRTACHEAADRPAIRN